MELYLIPPEDYNRSTGQTLALGPDQILVHQNRRQYGRDTLTLAGRTFQVAGELPEFLDNGFSTADIVTSLFIVTPDYDTLEALRASVNASYGDGGSIAVRATTASTPARRKPCRSSCTAPSGSRSVPGARRT